MRRIIVSVLIIVLLMGACNSATSKPTTPVPTSTPVPTPTTPPITTSTPIPIPVPVPVPVPVSPVVPAPILPKITPTTSLVVKEDAALKNLTWNELKDFLLSDNTDKHFYVYPSYTSKNFAETLQNNAKKSGWRCAIARIRLNWLNRQTGAQVSGVYYLNAFETTDQGIVYIDSTNPGVTPGGDYPGGYTGNAESIAKLEIGKNYNATFIFPDLYGNELVPDSMGVITGIDPLAW